MSLQRCVHACYDRNAVTLQVTDTIRSYQLNFHPVPHGVRVSYERDTAGFPVCYGSPSEVIAASSSFTHFYTLRFKKKRKELKVVAKATVNREGIVLWSKFVGRVEFSVCQWVIRKFRRDDSQWIWIFNSLDLRQNLEKGHSVQENHFCSRKVGTDATFMGKWWFVYAVPVQDFQARNQLHRSGSVWSSFWKIEGLHTDKTNIIICDLWKKFIIRF